MTNLSKADSLFPRCYKSAHRLLLPRKRLAFSATGLCLLTCALLTLIRPVTFFLPNIFLSKQRPRGLVADNCSQLSVPGLWAPSLAPWDPTAPDTVAGGGALLSVACAAEVAAHCAYRLPLRQCLAAQRDASMSFECAAALFPCEALDKEKSGGPPSHADTREWQCQNTKLYSAALTQEEHLLSEELLIAFDRMSHDYNITYWIAGGSTAGGLVHHGRIPWDDDVDVYVLAEQFPSLPCTVQAQGGVHVTGTEEQFKQRRSKTNRTITNDINKEEEENQEKVKKHDPRSHHADHHITRTGSANDAMYMSAIMTSETFLADRPSALKLCFTDSPRAGARLWNYPYLDVFQTFCYDVESCVTPQWSHRNERLAPKSTWSRMACSALHLPPVMAVSRGEQAGWGARFTLEELVDGPSVLSSVLFDEVGNEVWRSYAEGLMGAGGAITYTPSLPVSAHGRAPPLVPFFAEQREAYRRNVAQRSAEALNAEVLPMLDRVQVVNRGAPGAVPVRGDRELRIVFWNAGRGGGWAEFAAMVEKRGGADIVILNEMDWGMARTGNVHTTELLAERLSMNFAYGVEFLELTNGNVGEQRKTAGQRNAVGFHGNAVLSRFRIE
eukprot:Selendium_serpulae@DN6265_c0_g1_i3.p1